jgi:predicted N-acetyltransferase YhbS
VLDRWLREQALKNQAARATRTFVVCDADGAVAGYFSLAAGAVRRAVATGKARRNMPDPIPAVILARLAVSEHCQRQGLGSSMLQDAVLRVLQSAESIGVRVMLVHAISEEAENFYKYFGFRASPIDKMTLMATLDELRAATVKVAR